MSRDSRGARDACDEGEQLLARYILDCQRIRRDLVHLVSDLNYAKQGSVRYAVDFSEIFAFAVPEDKSDEFSFFVSGTDASSTLVQQMALHKLFYGLDHRPILLGEYALELRSFLSGVRTEDLRQTILEAVKVEELGRAELKRIAEFSRVLSRPDSDLPRETLESVAEFLQLHAGWLVRILYPELPEPIKRIRQLLSDERLEDMDNVMSLDREPDPDVIDHWFERLSKARHARWRGPQSNAASRIDAHAIATVQLANREMERRRRRTRLRLVTRSSTMHRLLARGSTDPDGGGTLRHPRVFSVLYTLEETDVTARIQQIEERIQSIDLFLLGVKKAGSGTRRIDRAPALMQLTEQFHALAETFAMRGMVAAFLSATAPAASRPRAWLKSPEQLRTVLQVLRDRNELREAFRKLVAELDHEWDLDHQLLGVYVQSLDPEKQEKLDHTLYTEKFGTSARWRATVQGMPYSLEFYNVADVQRLFESLHPISHGPPVTEAAATAPFGRESPTLAYERLLAFAYMLAVLSEWELAERYCDAALTAARRLSIEYPAEVPKTHEVYFLSAICRRKREVTPERLVDAIRYIDRAARLRRSAKPGKQNDPRYLKEKSTLIFRLLVDHGQTRDWGGEVAPERGLALLQTAEQLARDDVPLLTQIVNNRLYFTLYFFDLTPHTHKVIRDNYEHLRKLLPDDCAEWAPAILHTVAVVDWMYFRKRDPESKRTILDMLNTAAASPELELGEKKAFQTHAAAVEKDEDIPFNRAASGHKSRSRSGSTR